MFGALGNTWRYKFYMGTQNDMNLDDQARFFYSPLNQSYTPYKLPHIGSHALQFFTPTHYVKKWGIPVITHI